MDGILNIYKEKGYTSHDVVAVVRKTVGQKKVGHTGTLDPDAEGVLPICLGKATKLADYIMAERKAYRAVMTLGATTTTQDASGEILEKKEILCNQEEIEKVILSFIGEGEQIPPMYSAIKIQGKKLYELARKGVEVERKPRKMTIFDIVILSYPSESQVEFVVHCSKGTYIRTLCADIGEKLGCGAYMQSLLRMASGAFTLENAIRLSELKVLAQEGQVESILLPMEQALNNLRKVIVSEKSTKFLYNGGKIYEDYFTVQAGMLEIGEKVLGYDYEKKLVGIYEVRLDQEVQKICIKPLTMLC